MISTTTCAKDQRRILPSLLEGAGEPWPRPSKGQRKRPKGIRYEWKTRPMGSRN